MILRRLFNRLKTLFSFLKHNASNVFAGKFIYFLLLAIGLTLIVIILYVLRNDAPPGPDAVYNILLVPGVLLVFYPAAFCIQSDLDSKTLETLFGVPDYRYKVWLVRSLTQYIVIGMLLAALVLFCRLGLADFNMGSMLMNLMFPVAFLGSFGFMAATITRSGNSTAVVLVVVILFFWIGVDPLDGSSWNFFHNPFAVKEEIETLIWKDITLTNRIYLLVGAFLSTLFALLRLQHREKFF